MHLSKTSFAMGAVTALVLASGSAYAATGGKFILGQSNSAGKVSVLKNPNGTPLALGAKAGTPPLRVNSKKQVRNLNADLLDGRHESSFALAAGRTGAFDLASDAYDFDEDGLVDTLATVASCPPGTRRTGGGGADFTISGYAYLNGPGSDNTWIYAVGVDETVTENPADVIGSIVCYNPRGGVSGAYTRGGEGGVGPAHSVEPTGADLEKLKRGASALARR